MTRVARIVIVWLDLMYYHSFMARAKKFEFENPLPVVDDEDEQTLAAIDEGMKDAENGRVVPAEEVRKLLPQWITGSPSATQ